jgi:hypothetical protein
MLELRLWVSSWIPLEQVEGKRLCGNVYTWIFPVFWYLPCSVSCRLSFRTSRWISQRHIAALQHTPQLMLYGLWSGSEFFGFWFGMGQIRFLYEIARGNRVRDGNRDLRDSFAF